MVGLQILKRQRQVDAQYIQAFAEIPVANISDVMTRMTAGGPRLRPFHKGARLGGPALTVKARPGDNLMIHKALDMAQPGDVIVVDAGGDLTNSLFGEIMVSYAMKRQLGGAVFNGAIRDVDFIGEHDFPIYAAGVTHRGPYKDGPGEINVPVAIDGMVIEPGDLILGDGDGILCVPYDATAQVLAAAIEKQKVEGREIGAASRAALDRAWVDARLRQLGCEM